MIATPAVDDENVDTPDPAWVEMQLNISVDPRNHFILNTDE